MTKVPQLTREQIDDADKKFIRAQYQQQALKDGGCTLAQLKKRYLCKLANQENLHATHIAHDVVERHVLSNPGIFLDDELFDLAYRASDTLAELYQKIGQKL